MRVGVVSAWWCVAVLTAGCFGSPAAPPAADVPRLHVLADVPACPGIHPDGSLVPCENEAAELDPVEASPGDWVCVHHQSNDQGPTWQLWHDPVDGRHGLWVVPSPDLGPHDVILRVRAEGAVHLFHWSAPAEPRFVAFPDPFTNGTYSLDYQFTMRFVAYTLEAAWEPGDAEIAQWWTLYENQFWLTHHVTANGSGHAFPGTNSTVLVRHTNDDIVYENWHAPESRSFMGADFRLDVAYGFLGVGRTPYPLDGVTPDRFCYGR